MEKRGLILGVDFDNTVVSYDDIMHETAVQFGLIQPHVKKSKKEIRDTIRQQPDGERRWQKVQTFVYGRGMLQAVLIEGVSDFFNACRKSRIRVYIISHKTSCAANGEEGVDFRQTAKTWMKENGFFDKDRLGLPPDHLYFASTRQEKIGRIQELGCTHFIDDLEETFLEPSFPWNVEKILYSPHRHPSALSDVKAFASWWQIHEYFFGKDR